MKTYVITVSQTFPATHIRAGQLTRFPYKIEKRIKIHTIRSNYELWKWRMDQINKGLAVLSVRAWSGKPYRSKQIEIISLNKSHGIGIQKITLTESRINEKILAKNDGLTLADFKAWFAGYDKSEPMAIIHFTSFRYQINKTNYEVVGRYANKQLAYGMKKKKSLEPQYSSNKLKRYE